MRRSIAGIIRAYRPSSGALDGAPRRTNVSLRGTAAPLSLNLLSHALATCYAAKRPPGIRSKAFGDVEFGLKTTTSILDPFYVILLRV